MFRIERGSGIAKINNMDNVNSHRIPIPGRYEPSKLDDPDGKECPVRSERNPKAAPPLLFVLLVFVLLGCDTGSQDIASTVFDLGPKALVQSVAFSPNGEYLAAGSYLSSNGVGVWLWHLNNSDLSKTPPPVPLKGHTNDVNTVAFSPDGQTLASGADDKTVRLWKVSQPDSVPIVLTTTSRVETVAFSPDGKMLAAGRTDGEVAIWQLGPQGQVVGDPLEVSGSREAVHSVTFSPDARMLVASSQDRTIYLWNVDALQAVPKELSGSTSGVTAIAFSPDSQTLASGSFDKTVRLWDLTQQDPSSTILGSCQSTTHSVSFGPNSNNVAAGCQDNVIRIWARSQANTSIAVLTGHRNRVNSIAFSTDGTTLASGSDDETVRMWKMNQLLLTPTTHP